MPYSGRMPSRAAIAQACREDLTQAPKGHRAFVEYIIVRARAIDRQAEDTYRQMTARNARERLGAVANSNRPQMPA